MNNQNIITDRDSFEALKIRQSEEYKQYLAALCKLASRYVSRIRVQFAEKAFEMFQDATTRRIVLAYGEELEKLEESRLSDFDFVSRYGKPGETSEDRLEDFCLNHAGDYAATVFMLFDIDRKTEV